MLPVHSAMGLVTGRSGLVVARLPAAREVPGSNYAVDKKFQHCSQKIAAICSRAWAAH